MKVIVGDTETTAKYPDRAEMLQFAAFKFDISEDNRVSNIKFVSRFFMYDKPIPMDSTEVHGLNNTKLRLLSGGEYLEDVIDQIADFVYAPDCYFVGHNVNYDKAVINNNLLRHGLERPKWYGYIDTCGGTRTYLPNPKRAASGCKLEQVFAAVKHDFGYSQNYLEDLYKRLTGETTTQFHGAGWDSFCTMIIYLALKQRCF